MRMSCVYLCGEMVYDGYRDASVTGACSQRNIQSIRNKCVETPLCTNLDESVATITSHLK